MTVDEIMLEIEILSDEELHSLINKVYGLKKAREEAKKKEVVEELRKAWIAVTSLGVDIYDNDGNLINNFEDLDFYF